MKDSKRANIIKMIQDLEKKIDKLLTLRDYYASLLKEDQEPRKDPVPLTKEEKQKQSLRDKQKFSETLSKHSRSIVKMKLE